MTNFRLFKEKEIVFSPAVNWIYGNNGKGKTTILEALFLNLTGRSFLTSRLKECLKEGEEHFSLTTHFEKEGVKQSLRLFYSKERVQVWHNRTLLPTLNRLLGIFPVVHHTPDDMQLIKGGPAYRRKFLDLYLSQQSAEYLFQLMRYTRSLKQRNALFKQNAPGDLFFPWEEEMAKSGAFIHEMRHAFVEQTALGVNRIYSRISTEKEMISLKYPALKTCEEYRAGLKLQRERERVIGYSIVGPHRDDMTIKLNAMPIQEQGSEGEKRLICSALRLCQWELLQKSALFLFDDLALGFDQMRKEALIQYIATGQQCIMTTPFAPDQEESSKIKLFLL